MTKKRLFFIGIAGLILVFLWPLLNNFIPLIKEWTNAKHDQAFLREVFKQANFQNALILLSLMILSSAIPGVSSSIFCIFVGLLYGPLLAIPMNIIGNTFGNLTSFEILRRLEKPEKSKRMEKEERGYSSAWLHHKGRNKHHFEYWTDVSTAEDHWKIVGVKMPVNYLAEMVMDRIAASKIYQGRNYTDAAPYTYFSRNKEYIVMHPETKACLDKILLMLKEKGERKTFAYIRKLLKDGDY